MDVIFTLLAVQAVGFTALGWRLGLWFDRWEPGATKRDIREDLANTEWYVDQWRRDEQ